jgi:hypothetical protein
MMVAGALGVLVHPSGGIAQPPGELEAATKEVTFS